MEINIQATGYPELIAALRDIAGKVSDFRFIWPRMAAHFYDIERQTFSSQGRSTKWAPLSAGYAKYKAAKFPGKPILQREGALITSLTGKGAGSVYKSDPSTLETGSSVPYGMRHQTGGGRLPARPVIDLNERDFDAFGKIMSEGLNKIVSDAGFQTARIM